METQKKRSENVWPGGGAKSAHGVRGTVKIFLMGSTSLNGGGDCLFMGGGGAPNPKIIVNLLNFFDQEENEI